MNAKELITNPAAAARPTRLRLNRRRCQAEHLLGTELAELLLQQLTEPGAREQKDELEER